MEQPMDLIRRELPQEGAAASVPALMKLVEQRRITPETDLPPMRFLFKFNGTPCFPVCELVAGTGKAKSGKTLFMSMIMAACLTPKVLALERYPTPGATTGNGGEQAALRVLWYDTEQSEQSTQDILVNRIMPMAAVTSINDTFFAINVRGMGYEKRRELLRVAIANYKPDLVILDGIKDLMLDINDATQATQTVEELMCWAQHYECCIVSVLHQNKSEADRNMRGSIGTEMMNKAFEVFCCDLLASKDGDKDIFRVEHYMSRKEKARQMMYYKLSDEGLPEACEGPDEQPRDERGRWKSPKSPSTVAAVPEVKWESFDKRFLTFGDDGKWQWNLKLLFTEVIGNRRQRPFNEVMAVAMKLSKIQSRSYYYTQYNEAVAQGIIRKETALDTGTQYVVLCENELPF